MKKKETSITKDLVIQLEKRTMRYTEMQSFVYYHPSRDKRKHLVSRGYWCTNLTSLFNNHIIHKHPLFGYYAIPGTSDRKTFYDRKARYRKKENNHKQCILHPEIRKKINEMNIQEEFI